MLHKPELLLTPTHRLRRQLLKGGIGTLVAAAAAYFGWTKEIAPPLSPLQNAKTAPVSLGKVADLTPNGAPVFVTPPGQETTYAVENDGGTVRVLNAKCTHQGCIVGWDAADKQFLCPCHAARYSRNGDVVSGPAPRPLASVAASVRGGDVFLE